MSNSENFLTDHDIRFIFNELRKATITWKGRRDCLENARKKVVEGKTKKGSLIYKYLWQCAICNKWFRNIKDMEVDHIVEIGGVSSFKGDWNEIINKMFPRPVDKHLQCLCVVCHQRKTGNYMNASKKFKRK